MGHIRFIRLFPTPESDFVRLCTVELDYAHFDRAITVRKLDVQFGRENTGGNTVGKTS